MFTHQQHVWNTGYFVTTVGFVRRLYAQHQPELAAGLAQIEAAIGSDRYEQTLHEVYPQLTKISFDDAILAHVTPSRR
jgi:mannose-1-phosphate guanylyltransferase